MAITISKSIGAVVGANEKEESRTGTNDEASDSNCSGATEHERSISTIELQPPQQPIASTKQEVCIQFLSCDEQKNTHVTGSGWVFGGAVSPPNGVFGEAPKMFSIFHF